MGYDVFVLNWVFIVFTSVCMGFSLKRIILYRSKTIADYIILIIYIFNCVPVLCDVVIGLPVYVYWYEPFSRVIADFDTCAVYNTYVLLSEIILAVYAFATTSKRNDKHIGDTQIESWRNPLLDCLIYILPIGYLIAVGGMGAFGGYTSLISRGLESSDVSTFNQLIMVSIYFYITRFFQKNRSKHEYVIMLIYFVLLIWLNGKRYIIVTIAEELLYMYQVSKRNDQNRIPLMRTLIAFALLIVGFSVFYLSNVKVTQGSDYMYGTLRVDFGRDDVTKYAINKVLFEKVRIVDFPGQTFLSMIFMFVPRSIWPGKPYPHYRYLTASILGVSIHNIPAGTTPSLFEMSICNFGWLGLFVTIIVLLLLCKMGDENKHRNMKMLYLMLITNILTQALDAMTSLIVILVIGELLSKVRLPKLRLRKV